MDSLKALANNQKQSYANLPDPQVSHYTIKLSVYLGEICVNTSNELHPFHMMNKQYFNKTR